MSDIQDLASGSAYVNGDGTLVWSAFGVMSCTRTALGTYDLVLVNAVSAAEYTLHADAVGAFSMDALCVAQLVSPQLVRVRTRINGAAADLTFTLDIDRRRQGVVTIPALVPSVAPSPGGLTANSTIFVATTGSDLNDGSAASPVLTLERAIDLAATNWRQAMTISMAAGAYSYNRVQTFGGLPFGETASPLLILGGFTDELGTRTVNGFTSTPATDLQDTTLAATIPSSIAGTFVAGAAAGQIRLSDPALIGALGTVAVGDMWTVFTGFSGGNNGTFTVAAVNSAAGTLDLRNAQGVVADTNNGSIRSQKSFEGAFIRMVTGVNAGQRRTIREMGEYALGTLPVVAVASLTNNDNFTLTDSAGNAQTFEYQVGGGFVPVAGRTTIDVSALGDPSAAGVAVATANGINGVLPSVVAVRAFASGGNSTVQCRQMIPGSAGNVAITKAGGAGWTAAAAAGFGGGTTISATRSGVGAPTNTFRVNRPWASNPSNGDTFVIEKPNVTINYGASSTLVQWTGGMFGFKGIRWNNAGATPANVNWNSFALLFEEGVEHALNGGNANYGLGGGAFMAVNNGPQWWGNTTVNPFFDLATASNGQGPGHFFHDGGVNFNAGSLLSGHITARQVSISCNGPNVVSMNFLDAKRCTMNIASLLVGMAGQSSYFGRILEQTSISTSSGIINVPGLIFAGAITPPNISITQMEISNSGGHAILYDACARACISSVIGFGSAGLGIRAINSPGVEVITAGLTVTGLLGDLRAGHRAARTYTSFAGSFPANVEFDFQGDGSKIATVGATANPAETRTGTIGIGAAFVDIVFGTGFGAGVPALACLNTVDATATEVISAVWQAGTTLRVTVNAPATAAVVVTARAEQVQN